MLQYRLNPTACLGSKSLALALSLVLSLTPLVSASSPSWADDTLKGSVVQTQEQNNNPAVNYDDVKDVNPGTTLDMVISTALSSSASAEGDEFFAKVSHDYKVDGQVVIPRGTIVHGVVDVKQDAKRAGRNAYVGTRFDYMITPDGREIPIEGQHSTKDKAPKAVARAVGRASGYTLVGGVAGALMVLKYAGLPAIIASEGYALAGGAAVGGAIGLTAAMVKKGKAVMLEPGTAIRVALKEPLALPTMTMPDAGAKDIHLEGLDVKVLGLRTGTDAFGQPGEVTLSLDIKNYTENAFSSFDVALEDEYGQQFYPSPFGDTGIWFQRLTPNTQMQGNVSFTVNDPTLQHYLVFYKQYTREPIARIAIKEDMAVDKKTMKKLSKASRD